jgi:hydrogenase maturation protein HypF
MCLGIPGRVVSLVEGYAGQLALVDVEGAQRQVNVGMLEEPPEPGAWVLIHMGFAVEVIDADRAATALSGLELMGRPRDAVVRRRFVVHGLVQGVGFRPFVYTTAAALALSGSVANTPAGVVAEVEGAPDAVALFSVRLQANPPPLAVITGVDELDIPAQGGTGFTIDGSSSDGEVRTFASPDVATCADCRRELLDPANRRYRHPFITCTHCGPRFTIITALPYDRIATTMAGFPMCAACRQEYDDPADRRFHAQPIACPDCGPSLSLLDETGVSTGDTALREAGDLLASGKIVAIKGIGGYHLACDARNEGAVAELRRRKQRGGKPFAVMVAGAGVARGLVTMDPDEERLLTSSRAPIVLLPRSGADTTAESVAPGNPDLGILLPYSPLHLLLFESGPDALVMTSGNLSGEPIVTDDDDALRRLAPLVDAWLRHDRPIHVPCDDSVSRLVDGVELPIRRSRGHAPLPIALPFDVTPSLAAGADLKNACAIAAGRYAWVSQHIGDMDDLSTEDALTRTAAQLQALTGVRPGRLVADRHPGYRSTAWAGGRAAGRPVQRVQHHHAHIASVLGEHGRGPDDEVIGIAFDGTGYGTDGAIWGGEVLIAGYKSFRRAAHLGYVPLAGGDASVLRPYRMALSHLYAAGVPWDDDLAPVLACPAREREVLARQLSTGFGCVPTSSMGRLFDAVASLAGVRHEADYEAEAAIALEGLARTVPDARPYNFGVEPGGTAGGLIADPGAVIRAIVADLRSGAEPAMIAARFHAGVADLIVELASLGRDETGLDTVALGGGVFQNVLLLGAATRGLAARGFTVLRPRLLPPNDGGIALGQILIAASC